MEKLAIPAYPPELLEKKGARNSQAMVDFRGYTVESFLRAYRDCGPIFKTKVNGLDELFLVDSKPTRKRGVVRMNGATAKR